jgi:DNA-binding transcriptional ArsR family regulator/SAM-dependent methyltransferase
MLKPLEQFSAEAPLDRLAACLKAAGDPLRLEILRVLARGSYGVLELSRIFAVQQSGMSHHLKVLANAGLVATRREGNAIYYRRAHVAADEALYAVQSAIYVTLDTLALQPLVQQRLSAVQQERAQASQRFFAENAGKFREQQDLIASYPVYAEHVADMLDRIPRQRFEAVLEIGPGEGEFLRVLGQTYQQVFALDNSSNMLDKARTFATRHKLTNIQFLLGEPQLAVERGLLVDCVVMNMVLHHTPSPGDIFSAASSVLRPGGALVVTDLCRHNQQWASESCGDLWLGFEPQDFTEWATEAGLEEGQSSYFALRNGFQIQIRHFQKGA